MKVELESIVAMEELERDAKGVFARVAQQGEVIVFVNNMPAYVIQKFAGEERPSQEEKKRESAPQAKNKAKISQKKVVSKKVGRVTKKRASSSSKGLTLKAAAKQILLESEGKQMHVQALADAIYDRGLYQKKDGSKAMATQVRAMCAQYQDDFVALAGNIVQMKES